MKIDQNSQAMELNILKSISGQQVSGTDTGSNSTFTTLLNEMIQEYVGQGLSDNDDGNLSTGSINDASGLGSLDLKPEKLAQLAQMTRILAAQSMRTSLSSNAADGYDSEGSNDSIIGSSNNLSQYISLMNEVLTQNKNTYSNTAASVKRTATSLSGVSSDVSHRIDQAADNASQKYGIEKTLIKAVIQQESSFNPNAVSSCGAQGLMQLMPETAKSLGVADSFNISQNIDGGTKYLKSLLDNFNGNKDMALAAYNGGINRMRNLGVNSTAEIVKMPNETRNYVKKVIGYYEKNKNI